MATTATGRRGDLTAEEQRTWRAFARSARLLFAQLDRDLTLDAGMASGTYEILAILGEAPGRSLRMSDLAEATLSSPSRISHAVERLVDLGWVERSTCPSDRRGWFASLTDAGDAALRAARPRHAERIRAHLFGGLPPADAAELGRICATLLAHLPASGLTGGCDGG